MANYLIVTTLLNLWMGIIWRSDTNLNIVMKMIYVGMAIWSGVLAGSELGYIVKI